MSPGLLFSVTALLICLSAALLERHAPAAYYQLVQEDGPLEWATFWGFVLAGVLWLAQLRGRPRSGWRSTYLLCLGSGCLLLAMEEISWGQRLFGYLPPEVFLTDNFQQEFNLHNFADTAIRQLLLGALLVGFGLLWPLTGRWQLLQKWLDARYLEVFPLAAAPGFLLAWLLQLLYPWHASGEWVELLAALGFLTAAVSISSTARPMATFSREPGYLLITIALGVLTASLLSAPRQDDQRLALAAAETNALARDFEVKRLRSRCGIHKRLFTFVKEYGARGMTDSDYLLPGDKGAVPVRKTHYLDPWNMPYWIRHRCVGKSVSVFVYSFGPNRRRDSSASAIGGDDVGTYVTGRSARSR
jgi:hypothetical protein